jgi:hypothetical protein
MRETHTLHAIKEKPQLMLLEQHHGFVIYKLKKRRGALERKQQNKQLFFDLALDMCVYELNKNPNCLNI